MLLLLVVLLARHWQQCLRAAATAVSHSSCSSGRPSQPDAALQPVSSCSMRALWAWASSPQAAAADASYDAASCSHRSWLACRLALLPMTAASLDRRLLLMSGVKPAACSAAAAACVHGTHKTWLRALEHGPARVHPPHPQRRQALCCSSQQSANPEPNASAQSAWTKSRTLGFRSCKS